MLDLGPINRVFEARFSCSNQIWVSTFYTWRPPKNRVLDTRFIYRPLNTRFVCDVFIHMKVSWSVEVGKMRLIPNFGRQFPDMNFRKGLFIFILFYICIYIYIYIYIRKIESKPSSSSSSHLKTDSNVWYWFVVSLFLGYFTVSSSLWFRDDAYVIILKQL